MVGSQLKSDGPCPSALRRKSMLDLGLRPTGRPQVRPYRVRRSVSPRYISRDLRYLASELAAVPGEQVTPYDDLPSPVSSSSPCLSASTTDCMLGPGLGLTNSLRRPLGETIRVPPAPLGTATRIDPIGALTHERPYKPHLGGFEPVARSADLFFDPPMMRGLYLRSLLKPMQSWSHPDRLPMRTVLFCVDWKTENS